MVCLHRTWQSRGFRHYVRDMALGLILRNHAFTRGFSELQIVRLASLSTEVTFRADAVILEGGRRSDFFYLIAQGSVAVELIAPRYSVCVQALGPDEVFGWSALLDRQDTLFQVRAREPVRVLRMDGARLAELCRSDAELGCEFYRRALKVVAGRVAATEERFAEMCGVKV